MYAENTVMSMKIDPCYQWRKYILGVKHDENVYIKDRETDSNRGLEKTTYETSQLLLLGSYLHWLRGRRGMWSPWER